MELKEQVLSVEQCKHLIELGLDMNDAAHCWYSNQFVDNLYLRLNSNNLKHFKIPTYTLQEILNILPLEINNFDLFIDYPHNTISYYNFASHNEMHCETGDELNIMDAAYKMLCWSIENSYLKI